MGTSSSSPVLALRDHGDTSADLPPLSQSSPLGCGVGVQHAAPLHPTPDSVHASQRLLFQAAAAPLDALLDPKHSKTETTPRLGACPDVARPFPGLRCTCSPLNPLQTRELRCATLRPLFTLRERRENQANNSGPLEGVLEKGRYHSGRVGSKMPPKP